MKILRTTVKNFVTIPLVEKTVLGMTILLCVVIFAELALEDQIGNNVFLKDLFD